MALDRLKIRGFTRWTDIHGSGSDQGEPHFGSHAWPAKNQATLAVVEDQQVERLLEVLHRIDQSAPQQGLRAFVWNIEQLM